MLIGGAVLAAYHEKAVAALGAAKAIIRSEGGDFGLATCASAPRCGESNLAGLS